MDVEKDRNELLEDKKISTRNRAYTLKLKWNRSNRKVR